MSARPNHTYGLETNRLTGRERDVVNLLARGCTYSQIGERLGVSLHTVGSHTKNVYRKLDVHNAAAAVARAAELGLIAGLFAITTLAPDGHRNARFSSTLCAS